MRPHRITLLTILILPLLLAFPLPVVFTTHLLAAPDQEAAPHAWGLWAALQELDPLVIETRLLAFPRGVEIVLVDPANLPAFALGLLYGPAAAYNLTLYAGLVLMGIAGALLARQVGGQPILGAIAAQACPTLLANAADGMTEGFGIGWVGIQLALLLRWKDSGRRRDGLLAAGALAAAFYAGPYNGVWAAILDGSLGLWLLARRRWTEALRLVQAGLAAALLVLPLALSIGTRRAGHLPGSSERAGLPAVVENPAIFRGGVQTGADLMDPFLPGLLTGGEAPISHTAYLGLALLGMAVVVVVRDRGRGLGWLAGGLCMALLSLGPFLYLGGRALRIGGDPLLGPAGLLILALPLLGRLTRWYRAGAVASLLLVPLASRMPRRAATGVALGLVLVLDVLLLAPLQWPLHASPLPEVTPYRMLRDHPAPGAVLELPPVTTATPPPGHWRDLLGLTQPLHGRPVGGSMMNLELAPEGRKAQAAIESLLREGRLDRALRQRMLDDGFRWLAVHPAYRPLPADAQPRLQSCFGPPLAWTKDVWIFDLAGGGGGSCGH